jgi:hypothetical protein
MAWYLVKHRDKFTFCLKVEQVEKKLAQNKQKMVK